MDEDKTLTNQNIEPSIPTQKPLFTHERRESFVLSFIEAWNTHQVWLEFPKSTREKSNDPLIDLLILSSVTYSPLPQKIFDARKHVRESLSNQIKIVSGSIDATPEVIYKAVDELYNLIVDLQGASMLGGSFLTREMEDRIYGKVMEKVDKHIDKVREEFGLNDV